MSQNITGITKEQYEQWCKESETYNLSGSDLEKDLLRVKSINQEEIINLENQQFQILKKLSKIIRHREFLVLEAGKPLHNCAYNLAEEEKLSSLWVKFWRVTDYLGSFRQEMKAIESLPQ